MTGFLGLVLLSALIYAANGWIGVVHPASTWGIWYGIVATSLLVAVMAYGGRRRTLKLRALGRSHTYLLVHVYGGMLFLVLQFMHTGFSLPDGPLTWLLWLLSIWVVVTGIVGVLLQKWLAVMLNQLRTEVQLTRIPALVGELQARAEKIASGASTVVRDLFTSELAAALAGPEFSWRSFAGFVDDRANRFQFVRSLLPPDRHGELDDLRELVRTKAEMDVHFALQTTLRKWLWVHIPPALVLIGLVLLHIFVILYF